jgi:branched-chain amino acid aminotransferase
VDWDVNNGWGNPVISPYHKFELDPAISALHYALQAFEGMKAYIDQNGKIRLFRPERNMERLRDSARRLCFPV